MGSKFKKNTPKGLFEVAEEAEWRAQWVGMPEFSAQGLTAPYHEFIVRVRNQEDLSKVEELLDQRISTKCGSLWYPIKPNRVVKDIAWRDEDKVATEGEQ